MPGQQRGPRPASTRGDYTGNKKQALLKQHEEQVNERREELGIVSERTQSIKDEGVVNLMGDKPVLEHPELEQEDAEQLDVTQTPDGKVDVTPTPQPMSEQGEKLHSSSGQGNIEVFELPEERVTARTPQALTQENQNAPTTIKVLYDLEQVTIGQGNTYDFKAEYRYKVPRWVAAHLEEKGLCIVLSLQPA